MTKLFRGRVCLIIGALLLGISAKLGAATIYDNSVNDLLTRFSPGTREVGDEIHKGAAIAMTTSPGFRAARIGHILRRRQSGSDAIYPVANLGFDIAVVPEPSSVWMLCVGGGLWGLLRKRKG